MFINYEQIFIIYILFFSVLADLSNAIWQSMLLVDYKSISTENRPFSWKILIFIIFGPLGDTQDIKIFEKLFDIFKAHIKRRLLVAIKYQDSNLLFFCMGIRCTLMTFHASDFTSQCDLARVTHLIIIIISMIGYCMTL